MTRRGSETVRTCGGAYHIMWHAPISTMQLGEQRNRRYRQVPHKHDIVLILVKMYII
jgi:hypothetical protein